MELEFEVKTARLGSDAFVVSVTGETDLHSAPGLERELREVLELGGRSVLVDLVSVGYIDSTALGLLLKYQPRFRSRGGDLVIVSDDRRILRTFEITGLDRVFRIEPRLGDAVAGLYPERLSTNGDSVGAQVPAPEPA
jgi:anti-sigma B factor antagonist